MKHLNRKVSGFITFTYFSATDGGKVTFHPQSNVELHDELFQYSFRISVDTPDECNIISIAIQQCTIRLDVECNENTYVEC